MSGPKIAVVGVPGKWSTEVLAEALAARTGFRCVLGMQDISVDLDSGRAWAGDVDVRGFDGVIVKKIDQDYSPNTLDRAERLRAIEAHGIRVFSPAQNILRVINRLACTVSLRNNKIPMPETVITEDLGVAMDTVKRFGSVVLKPLYSTKARGMQVLDCAEPEHDIRAALTRFAANNPTLYLQRKIDLQGQDLGMVFLGGDYLGTYARVASTKSWNTTIASGGRYVAHHPPQDIIDLAQRAQQSFQLDFTTVDVAMTGDGPVVFEVSAFGGFRGAKEGAGIDAATLYADYALSALR